MFNKILIISAFAGILLAQGDLELQDKAIIQDEVAKDNNNYVLSAQMGLYYTQQYGNYIHDDISNSPERKVDFSNIFVSVGFEGIEFNALRFGANALGSIKLSGAKSAGDGGTIYRDNMAADGLLYQLFLGYTSDYFDISVGREVLDLEWVNDFVQGARFAVKIPEASTSISGYYFDRQAVADPNEIVTFEDNKVGPTFILGISNNSLDFLAIDLYYMSLDTFNGVGLGGVLTFGNEDFISSNTILKYTFLDSKKSEYNNTNYLQVEENLGFNFSSNNISVALGVIKMFNAKNLDALEINVLGDQNPLEQGDYAYLKDALTVYVGATYSFDDLFKISLIYGNTSGYYLEGQTKQKASNEINLGLGTTWNGMEIGLIYSKILSDNLEVNSSKKINRDYFEAMVAYNF